MLDHNKLNISQKIILLTATAYATDDCSDNFIQLLKNQPDWQFIRQFSEKHGTAPLLYKFIKKNNLFDLIPEDLYNYFQAIYFQTHTHNILALDQFKKVLSAFNKEAIKTVLIKGIASAEFIYKDLGLRPMGDIDIMVEPERLLDAEKILFSSGYINERPYKSYKLRTLKIYNHLNAFLNKNIKIELHRELNSLHHIYSIPSEQVWRNLKKINIEDENAYILNTEMNLQYLSVHSVRHFLQKKIRLNSFTDIADLIKLEKDNINWIELEKECSANKNTLPVYRALSLCKTYLNAPIPKEMFNHFDIKRDGLENQFLYLLNNQTEKISFKTSSNYFKKIQKIDGIKNKLHYLWAEVFPSKAFIVHTYKLKNKNLYFLYYFVQFFRQVGKTFKNIIFIIMRFWKK